MANRIYRGPVTKQPRTVSRPVTGALKPGTFVNDSGAALAVPAAGGKSNLLLLTNREFYDHAPTAAYTSGETGIAYYLEPGMEVQALAVAATYTEGQGLTTNSSGLLVAAAATDAIVAHVNGSAGVLGADGLIDVVIANSYNLPYTP